MFKQLSYFHSLQDDISKLQTNTKTLNELLSEAYTSPQKIYCSLKEQIQAIIAEQSHLADVIAVISQQVGNQTFIPSVIEEHQLTALNFGRHFLPEWFSHVFSKQYKNHKQQLDYYCLNLFKMHQLNEKRNTMTEQKNNLELLYRRFISLSQYERQMQSCSEINIMEDVNHLKNRIGHVRKSYLYFCHQIAAKISEFVDQIINKTKNFASPVTSRSQVRQYSKQQQFNQPLLLKSRSNDLLPSFRMEAAQQPNKMNSPMKSRVKVLQAGGNRYLNEMQACPDFQYKVQQQFQRLDDYKLGIREQYKIRQPMNMTNRQPMNMTNTSFARLEPQYSPRLNLQNAPGCCNHSHAYHKHTCSKSKTNGYEFRQIKSADKPITNYYLESNKYKSPSPSPFHVRNKYDYREYIQKNSKFMKFSDYYA